uniref:Uncharacterized protein n=1 Tax=Nelumbo nucifera TaxID=4432 RepID=A0A822ZLT2_NELNU|nr:TPA_asm: hypothetical protein HUJ06_002711 [Nelumbo nucifera]
MSSGMGLQVCSSAKKATIYTTSNSYKHSGLANKKTVTIQPGGKDLSVVLATTKTKTEQTY